MPRRTAVCHHVSHRVIYSPFTLEMPWHAMGSKNSAYADASDAHRLARRPDSVSLVAKCGESLQRGFPVLVFVGVDLAVLELRALLGPQLDRRRGFGRVRRHGVQGEARAVGCGNDAEGVLESHEKRHEVARGLDAVILEGVDGNAERIELTENGPIIHVLGADLRDGTPIFDIKPYIPFADCHPDAQGGFIDETPWQELTVHCPAKLLQAIPEEKREGLLEVLGQDPRRAGSKHEPERTYHLAYAGFDIAFTVDNTNLHVQRIEPAIA